jgi:hypothetical protein
MSLCLLVVMTGCVMPAKTKVTKDGFTARQKTTEAHRAIVEDYDVYRTDCRWDQQMKDKDGEYYCPPPASKDAYDSHVYMAAAHPSVMETYGPALISGTALVAGAGMMMHGLQTQAVSPGVQQGGNSISTFVACGSGKAFNGIGAAPGCK